MTAYTRTEHLRHELAEQIRNGTLKPGERIMSETRLAEEYQVSRGTAGVGTDSARWSLEPDRASARPWRSCSRPKA